MAQKLRKVRPSKYWEWEGEVQISEEAGDYFKTQDVYWNGKKIGALESYISTPRVNIPGTRLGRDLKPRKVWKHVAPPGVPNRLTYESRNRAIRDLISDAKGNN